MDALLLILAASGFDLDGLDGEAWYAHELAIYLPSSGSVVELGDNLGRSAGKLPADRAAEFLQVADLDDTASTFAAWEALAA